MRPEILFPLFAPVTTLPGIGPRTGKLVEKAAGPNVVDLLWQLPTGLVDRRLRPLAAEAPEGQVCTLTVIVEGHYPGRTPRQPWRVRCADASGALVLVYFHPEKDWLQRLLPLGATRLVSGKVEHYDGTPQITHPDYVVAPEDAASLPSVEPVYPLTQGLSLKVLAKARRAALERTPELPEWQDAEWLRRRGWPGFKAALDQAHAPEEQADLEPLAPARARLAFDELLANQLALGLVRANQRRQTGRPLVGDGRLQAKVRAALPFELTDAQERAVREIAADQARPQRMLRLLQGDVGAGKTLVALLAMLNAIEAGAQAALMAPTEILARQHLKTLTPLAEAAGVKVAVLTGSVKGRARTAALEGLASGEIHIVVGTHALIEEDVAFRDLGLVVVDEQHRFGVHQRLTLASKGRSGADVLVMSATPIPRTLTLTAYGDMDVSRLTGKPPGRQPIDTRALPLNRLDEVVAGVERAMARGARVYWVCPLVEESEVLDVAAAEARALELKARFGPAVGLVHGRMKATEKDAVMRAFASGEITLLVATTVIEVGVDVPEATVMVIEHAERFGLAQLHQLRGRVGRGEGRSFCMLLYASSIGITAQERLRILRQTEDGFEIAEADLRLRGAGEILGTRQAGMPEFRIADLAAHADLVAAARDDARLVLDRDPDLSGPRGPALRTLLYLFERDAAARYLRSG
jgi:ATP-dependent DNA helicase RecG